MGGSHASKHEISDSQCFCRTDSASLSTLLWHCIANTFGSVIGAATAELVFRNRNAGSADRTFTTWTVVICSQFIQALSIITACVPYLKLFFSNLETGMIRTDDSRRLESRSRPSKQRSKARRKKSALSTKLRSSGSRPGSSTVRFNVLHEDYIPITHIVGGHSHKRTNDTGSQTSHTRILKQTDIWVGNT